MRAWRRSGVVLATVLAVCAALVPGRALAAARGPEGAVVVVVHDGETGEKIAGASVRVQGRGDVHTTDREGRVRLPATQGAPVEVLVSRDGYAPSQVRVTAASAGREVLVAMTPVAGEVVTVFGRPQRTEETYRPVASLSDTELQRSLSSSIPETLREVPGFAVAYNGPGAARPTMRGLGSDRVLVLEDGLRLGDLYGSASDHGVTSDPLTARRLEVIRGPVGVLYGSNALGGVVNVVRDQIPHSSLAGAGGSVVTQYESVNGGMSGGGALQGPLGPLALRIEGSARQAGDTRTPLGPLERSGLEAFSAGVGSSIATRWGLVGLAVRHQSFHYGVPGEFAGQLVPGGHPGGVELETGRTSGQLRGIYRRPTGPFDFAELNVGVTRYLHDEIEAVLAREAAYGARFEQLAVDGKAVAHHRVQIGADSSMRLQGASGVAWTSRSLTATGSSPGTRSGDELSLAVFGYEELQLLAIRLQGGVRYDRWRVRPESTAPIQVRTEQRTIEKMVAPRGAGALSGSLAAIFDASDHWSAGLSLARSFRAPSLQELYSDGPHLADYSYDIGSPELGVERGLGADVFLRVRTSSTTAELAMYHTAVKSYIHHAPTGETVRVIRDGTRPRSTPVYEARAEDVGFTGLEGELEQVLGAGLSLAARVSYTRATRRSDGDPLPFIPPLTGLIDLRGDRGPFFGTAGVRLVAPQERVPRPAQLGEQVVTSQTRTGGAVLVDAGVGWRHDGSGMRHVVTLDVDNLTDRSWRDHLSRLKDVAPQPGRNVRATYRVEF